MPVVREIEARGLGGHRDGVEAIFSIAEAMSEQDWARSGGCPAWRGTDLAGHLLTTIRVWNGFLTRGLAGDGSVEFSWDDFDDVNAKLLSELPPASGPERVAMFADESAVFYERLGEADAGLVIGTPATTHFGREVSMADFASYGLLEWHLHAHDLAVSAGERYEPKDLPTVNRAVAIWLDMPEGELLDLSWSAVVSGRPGSQAA